MTEAASLPPEFSRRVAALARALRRSITLMGLFPVGTLVRLRTRGEFPYAVVEAVDPDTVQVDPLTYL